MISASPHGRLPTGFREVEWLQGSGTQYCETDILPVFSNSHFTSIKGDFTVLNKQNSRFKIGTNWYQTYSGVSSAFGFNNSFSYVHKLPQDTYESDIIIQYGLISAANYTQNISNYVYPLDVHYEINKNNLIVNQTTSSKYSDVQYSAINTRPILIGAGYTGSSADPINVINTLTKVKKFYIYDNDTLMYEFIPCYRTSDNKTGFMKITVADGSTTFFPSIGEDEWIIGPVV